MDFQITQHYPCSYLPGQSARSRVAVTFGDISDAAAYAHLIQHGYRRSGNFIYRPDCEHCQACIPARIPVTEFKHSRTQRRIWKRHQHLRITWQPLEFDPTHFALYQHYQRSRHPGGGMDQDARNGHKQYSNFLLRSTVDSALITFHDDDQLRMVSIVDLLPDGLSSVYTFFDPNQPSASYGTFSILWQAAFCHSQQLPYLYLGYWIKDCPKMRYKANFQPLQLLINDQWQYQQTDTTRSAEHDV